jgi:hypothetical protein
MGSSLLCIVLDMVHRGLSVGTLVGSERWNMRMENDIKLIEEQNMERTTIVVN